MQKMISPNLRKYLAVLLGLYPIMAVSSQTLLDAVMIAISIIWVIFFIRERRYPDLMFKKIGTEWLFLGYFLVVVSGFIFNASPDAPWFENLLKFLWILNLYILVFAFETAPIILEKVIKFIAVLVFFPTIYSLISYLHGTDLITGRDNSRITGLVNSATYHAHGNAVIFVFLMALYLFTYRKMTTRWQFFCIVSIALLGASIFLTLTRGIWLSIVISSVLMAALIRWKRAFQVLTFLGLLFGVMFFSFGVFRARIATPMHNDGSAMERINLFKVNIQMWQEYPLLGIGMGENLRRNREYWDRPEWKMPDEYITSHAHNQFINVLSTTGVFGLIFFCSFYFFFIYKNVLHLKSLSHQKSSPEYILSFACLWVQLEFLLGCLTDVSFEYAKIRALLILVWALVVVLDRRTLQVQSSES